MADTLRYPLQLLLDNQDYLKITCVKYEAPGLNDKFGTDGNFNLPSSDDTYRTINPQTIQGTIILPIPDNLPPSTNSTNWEASTFGPLEAGLARVGEATIAGSPIEGVKQLITEIDKVANAAQTGVGQKGVQSAFISQAIQQITGQEQGTNLLARQTGAVFNENTELLFRGVKMRGAFQFAFEMIPRSQKEAEQIKKIVRFFKKQMAAKKGASSGAAAGLFLKAPNVFKIEYMNGKKPHPYLNRFKICALTDLSFTFNGSNTYATYADGTPIHMQLGLTFQELTPIYDTDYDKGDGTGGIGY
jgi:hypothetical protein